MANWERIAFLNQYFAGTLAPRLELDLLPGVACGAHCVFVARHAPGVLEDYVAAGRALQRFWLTATGLGLQFQPEYTPLVFARYAREGARFTESERGVRQAQVVSANRDRLLAPETASRTVFMGAHRRRKAGGRAIRSPAA